MLQSKHPSSKPLKPKWMERKEVSISIDNDIKVTPLFSLSQSTKENIESSEVQIIINEALGNRVYIVVETDPSIIEKRKSIRVSLLDSDHNFITEAEEIQEGHIDWNDNFLANVTSDQKVYTTQFVSRRHIVKVVTYGPQVKSQEYYFEIDFFEHYYYLSQLIPMFFIKANSILIGKDIVNNYLQGFNYFSEESFNHATQIILPTIIIGDSLEAVTSNNSSLLFVKNINGERIGLSYSEGKFRKIITIEDAYLDLFSSSDVVSHNGSVIISANPVENKVIEFEASPEDFNHFIKNREHSLDYAEGLSIDPRGRFLTIISNSNVLKVIRFNSIALEELSELNRTSSGRLLKLFWLDEETIIDIYDLNSVNHISVYRFDLSSYSLELKVDLPLTVNNIYNISNSNGLVLIEGDTNVLLSIKSSGSPPYVQETILGEEISAPVLLKEYGKFISLNRVTLTIDKYKLTSVGLYEKE